MAKTKKADEVRRLYDMANSAVRKQWQMINGLMNRSKAKRAKIKLKESNNE